MTTVPIAFLFFNRPEPTLRVFDEIRRAKPKKLYLVSDGPRAAKAGEARVVSDLRNRVTQAVDWDVEVTCDFADTNLGCSKRVATGIGNVLSREESAIILEDDCLPSPAFFDYASTLLKRHANDREYMAICGTNLEGRSSRVKDYGICHFPMIWGWATWSRAWSGYQRAMPAGDTAFLEQIRATQSIPRFLYDDWKELYIKTAEKPDITWDYQFIFHCMRNNGVAAFPTANLITNIGYGPDATHTTKMGRYENCRRYDSAGSLEAVPSLTDHNYDIYFQWEYLFGKTTLRSMPFKVRYKIHEWLSRRQATI